MIEQSTGPSADRVTVVVPTYNERRNLAPLVQGIRAHGYRVLVVDDASPDGTGEEAERLASGTGGVEVLHRDRREGLGPAYSEGFGRAIAGGAEIVCGMDADLSHDPAALPSLVAPVAEGRADLVVGSRYVTGGGIRGWPLRRRLLSRGGNLYARLLLGLPVRDATSGFRALSAGALETIEPSTCRAAGYLYLTEMVWRAARRGLRLAEVPITFQDRRHGESKMGGGIVLEAMWLVTVWGVRRLLGGMREPKGPPAG